MKAALPPRYPRSRPKRTLFGKAAGCGRNLALGCLAQSLALVGARDAWAADPEPQDVSSEVETLSLEELMNVRISPFDVSTNRDRGYRAFSSVTGSRLDTPIKDLPFPIQAFTQSFIEDQKPVTIHDIAKYSPSVTYRSNDFNEGNANLAIRGFAVGSTPGSVQVLRDGFHGPSIFEFTNVSRLEIVKGPASFLYGQVAPGGIVNVITKTPRPELATSAMVRYGSYGSYRFEGDVTGPIRKGLMFRVTGSADQDIKYWRPYDGHSVDFAPALLWQPNRWVAVTLKQEYYRKRESPQVMQKPGYGRQSGVVPSAEDPNLAGVVVPGLAADWNSMSRNDFRSSDTVTTSAILDVRANEQWSLRASYARSKYQVDALFSGNFGMSNAMPFMQGRRLRRQTYTNWDDAFEANATGRYELGFASLRLLLGAQYVLRRFDATAGQAPNHPSFGPVASPLPNWDLRDPSTWSRDAPPISSVVTTGSTTRYRDRAAFAGATLGFLNSRLLLLAGARLTRTESQAVQHATNDAGATLTAQKLTPQYGILYKVTQSASLFATYAESFVPGTDLLRVRNVLTEPAAPTRGRGIDAGVKVDLLGGRLSGTLTAFDVRNTNIVNEISELDPATGMQTFTRVQSGEQRCSGLELDATISPIDNWQTYLSYSYNHARIVEFSGRDAAILASGPATPGYKEVFLFHGAPLQMSAPHLANLWSRYDVDGGPLEGSYFAAGANLVINQALLPDTPASFRQSYVLLNALAGYAWNVLPHLRASAELYGKNLTDREYRPSQSTRSRPQEVGVAFTVRY